ERLDNGQATCSSVPEEPARIDENDNKSQQRRQQCDRRDQPLRQSPAPKPIDQESRQRQGRDQPEMKKSVHSFIRSMRSTASVARTRKTAIMMASPTAASAAA